MLNSISGKASYFVFLLVVLMLAASAAFGQVPPDNNVEQAAVQLPSTVTASASAERVRFTSPNTVVQLRLEVYDEAGQKLLDTEQRGGNVLDWHLQGGAGERVADGVYLCVLTIKNLAGRLNQKLGLVTVNGQSTVVRSAAVAELNLRQTQTVGPVESGEAGLTVMDGSDAPVAVLANNGSDAQLARTRGALTFRIGNFFFGNDKEQMRLTEDGNLGLGTTKPKVKLDVAGVIRAREGFMFSDGSKLNVNEKGVLTRTNADGSAPSAVATTQNKLAKFTDNAGTVGDSVVTESAGNIGIGTPTPTQALDVANGRIVTTGSQTLTSTLDSVIEVKTTVTNNADFGTGFKARNTFNGSGNGPTGMDIAPTFAPTTSIGLARGFVSAAFFAPPPGVTISEAWGGNAATIYANTGGAVTNGNAFAINSPFAFGALKPTNQFGLHINNQGIGGAANSYGLFVDAQSGSLNNYSAIFAGGNVGIGTTSPTFKLHLVDPSNTGLRVQTNTAGGTVASFGGFGDFQIDAPGVTGGRFAVKENGRVGVGTSSPLAKLDLRGGADSDGSNDLQAMAFQWRNDGFRHWIRTRHNRILGSGNAIDFFVNDSTDADSSAGPGVGSIHVMTLDSGRVGIGTTDPTEKLTVVGIVQSTSGGFRFPDGSLQTTATEAGNTTFTTFNKSPTLGDSVDVPYTGPAAAILHLNLPTGGTYLVTATVMFSSTQNNFRYFFCKFQGNLNANDADYPGTLVSFGVQTMTFHAVMNLLEPAFVDLRCHGGLDLSSFDQNGVSAWSRRLTAVKIPGNLVVQ